MSKALEVSFIDDPHAPEIFAAVASGCFNLDGNVTITFESPRVDYTTDPGVLNRVVVARLVLPVSGAQGLVVTLNAFLEDQGLSPSHAVAGGHLAN